MAYKNINGKVVPKSKKAAPASVMSADARAAAGADGVEINYDEYWIMIYRCDFEDAKKLIADWSAEQRQDVLQRLEVELSQILQKTKGAGKTYDEVCGALHGRMVLRTILRQPDIRNVKYNTAPDFPKRPVGAGRNDLGLTPEEVQAQLAAYGVDITYGGHVIRVQQDVFAEAREAVAELSPEDRPSFMQSVNEALEKNLKIVEAGSASKKIYDDVYHDLMLWAALQQHAA